MPERIKLTEKVLREAVPVVGRDYQIFDTEVRGFAACIYRGGGRAFTLDYRHAGRQRRMTFGRWPEWSVSAARERAKEIRREIDAGADTLAQRGALVSTIDNGHYGDGVARRTKRLLTDGEKRSICFQTAAPGVSGAEMARRYAVNTNLIFKWSRDPRYAPNPVAMSPSSEGSRILPVEIVKEAPVTRHRYLL